MIIHQLRPLNTLRNLRSNQKIFKLAPHLKIRGVMRHTILKVLLGEFIGNSELFAYREELDGAFEEHGGVAVHVGGYGVVGGGGFGDDAQGLLDGFVVVVLQGLDVDFALADYVDAAAVARLEQLVGLENAFYELEGDYVLDAATEICEEEEAAFEDFYVCLLGDF